MAFNFGNMPKTTAATGFTLPGLTTASSAPNPMFAFGTQPQPQAGATAPAPLAFGLAKITAPVPSTTAIASVAPISTGATKPTGFSLNTSATPAAGFTLGATTASTGFQCLGTPATTTASTGLTLGTGSIVTQPTVSATVTTTATGLSTITVPTTTTSSVLQTPSGAMNFVQLEENINKWTIELEEQEKVFMNQVAQVNTWDRLLLSNGDKILSLNSGVEKVLLEQQQLDHELDFILAQQRELEECLVPLEKEYADVTVSDPERDSTYQMAENLNSQLKQMSEDLKEVIEHINERNKNQDSNDPIVQIGRILNAHMDSLQWVDQNTTLIQQRLDQVNKLTDLYRRDNESTQNI